MSEPLSTSGRGARFADLAREGFLHVVQHPLRSALTALTSAVAIAVTVNVISLSYGLDEDIRRDVARFGRLTVDVGRLPILKPGGTRERLGPADAAKIEQRLDDLGAIVVPRRQVSARAEGDVELGQVQVVSAPPAYIETLSLELVAGRWLTTDDDPDTTCALDAETARQLFPGVPVREVPGRTMAVTFSSRTVTLSVVGVLEDPLTYRALFETFDEGQGARTLTSALLSFRNVYVREDVVGDVDYTGISIRLPSVEAIDIARERLLRIWPQDASSGWPGLTSGIGVFVRKDWMDALGGQTSQGAFLGNIVWMIIVGVAAIMISTLNLITMRERFDEVAVRRCEGARRRDVAAQVTIEGAITAVVGGIVGLPIGYAGAAALRHIVGFPFRFDPGYAVIATGIALGLGLVASVLPARHAAKLQPARVLSRRLT